MSSEIRRTNPTRLKKIHRQSVEVTIELDPVDAGATAFSISRLDLDRYELPEDSDLVAVAYSGHHEMRAEIGTVGKPKIGKKFAFDYDLAGASTFRLLVRKQSSPVLLASCEQIKATRDGEDKTSSQSLLHVSFDDIGERLWRLQQQGGDRPVLVINNCEQPDLKGKLAMKDPVMRGLIVPQAFEQVLIYLADHWDSDDGEDHWVADWKRKLVELDVEDPPSPGEVDNVRRWASDATDSFCDLCKFVKDVARMELNDG